MAEGINIPGVNIGKIVAQNENQKLVPGFTFTFIIGAVCILFPILGWFQITIFKYVEWYMLLIPFLLGIFLCIAWAIFLMTPYGLIIMSPFKDISLWVFPGITIGVLVLVSVLDPDFIPNLLPQTLSDIAALGQLFGIDMSGLSSSVGEASGAFDEVLGGVDIGGMINNIGSIISGLFSGDLSAGSLPS